MLRRTRKLHGAWSTIGRSIDNARPLRLVIASPVRWLHEGLAQTLRGDTQMHLAANVSTLDGARREAGRLRPDVTIVDGLLLQGRTPAQLSALISGWPAGRLLLLVEQDSPMTSFHPHHKRDHLCLPRACSCEDLRSALTGLASGR